MFVVDNHLLTFGQRPPGLNLPNFKPIGEALGQCYTIALIIMASILQINTPKPAPTMFPVLDILASYAPALVTRRLAVDPKPISAPTLEHFNAVALFADISGFTPLTERLSQGGPQGVEELSRVLNTYFGQLIDLITAHGGDIVKFAGDALLALWPVETRIEANGSQSASPE